MTKSIVLLFNVQSQNNFISNANTSEGLLRFLKWGENYKSEQIH